MRIRDDLEGVVYVAGVVLAAGDTIPDGVTVGDHLTVKEQTSGTARKPRGRASASRATAVD
ncbi:hypothetical protein WKY82_09230 [Gordonia malaquae]|uniref:hypothetical protein n=1 Tax=Gordonia malaquae TaxID=410332 RepID=UPI0030C79B1B